MIQPLKDNQGDISMNVDGSVTPRSFRYTVPDHGHMTLLRLVFVIVDDDIRATRFGGLPALTNGVLVSIKNAEGEVQLEWITPFKMNYEWLLLSGNANNIQDSLFPNRNDILQFSWPIYQLGVSLTLEHGDYIEILIRDDLRGLTDFRVMATARMMNGVHWDG